MKIAYDNCGRVSEVKFDADENQELGFKAFKALIEEQSAMNKYAIDKNLEAADRVLEYNCTMIPLKFNNQVKTDNVDGESDKDTGLTT